MVKIMLASHGNLAAGMLSSAEMVFGKQDNVSVICAYETEKMMYRQE